MQEVRVHISKTPEEKHEEKSKAWIDRTVALVAVLSALTAIITVWVGHHDAVEMTKTAADSAKTAKDTSDAQFAATQLDERPIITLSPDKADVKYGKDCTLDFSLIVARAISTVGSSKPHSAPRRLTKSSRVSNVGKRLNATSKYSRVSPLLISLMHTDSRSGAVPSIVAWVKRVGL